MPIGIYNDPGPDPTTICASTWMERMRVQEGTGTVISRSRGRKEKKRYGEILEDDCPIPEKDRITRGTELDVEQIVNIQNHRYQRHNTTEAQVLELPEDQNRRWNFVNNHRSLVGLWTSNRPSSKVKSEQKSRLESSPEWPEVAEISILIVIMEGERKDGVEVQRTPECNSERLEFRVGGVQMNRSGAGPRSGQDITGTEWRCTRWTECMWMPEVTEWRHARWPEQGFT
ncbi:hypothetical protein B0H14DRAFT_2586047 [Mycena olivaceomarginata]|nr:hypothetical protein B0H14DRAFT_2586047 [Mycena olivaceomarginata]